jgi:preprotein translocase subunit SecF
MWFGVAGGIVAVSILALIVFGFKAGIEFSGGNEFQVPVRVGTVAEVEQVVTDAVHKIDPKAEIQTGQQIGDGAGAVYSVRTPTLSDTETTQVHDEIAAKFGLQPNDVIGSRVSASWGQQVSNQALLSLAIFLVAVTAYLSVRFEWRMAVAAVASLLFNLVATAAIYSIVGFEVSPATVIGFLTILGFALYDVVVVFDKVQENTRGITGRSNETYAEATNLALNQTFMRSINTSLVALLPVGGLLFIGAGLLGAGTLKDLGLVLFVGMGVSFYTSLFFCSPLLVELKSREPRLRDHARRVLAKRAAQAQREAQKRQARPIGEPEPAPAAARSAMVVDPSLIDLAGAAPKVGSRPSQTRRPSRKRQPGTRRR